ncbi:MAG: hypothetical protein L0Z53_06925 [Acidobacteriales bacterium]|nr:hypothetical protein [Terriglobales bacterium]
MRTEDIVPRGFQFRDARARAMIEENRAVMVQYIKKDEKKLQGCDCRARIVELSSSNHYVFFVSKTEVLGEMRAFLAGLPSP